MRVKDIQIYNYYRLKSNPTYTWVKVLQIFKPRELDKAKNFYIVQCEHTIDKNDSSGFIRYFKVQDLINVQE